MTSFHSPNDNSLFIQLTAHGCTILLLYVDDMIISRNDAKGIKDFKRHLMDSFKMTNFGHLTYFLGLEISRSNEGFRFHQRKYAEDLLASTRHVDCKSADTPLELNVKIRQDDGSPLSYPSMYLRLVGSLLYLTISRPDISHVVQTVS